MDEYKVTAWHPRGAKVFELRPISLSIVKSLNSPAVSMRGSFVPEYWPDRLIHLKVTRNGQTIMEGKIDSQRTAYGKDGMTLELEARNNGAALLDNEAMPRTYRNLYINQLFEEMIHPHGFVLSMPELKPPLAEFTVRKDQSLWEVFCAYSRRVYGTTPYLLDNLVVVGTPKGGEPLILGGAEQPFSSVEEVISLYHPIGRIVLRGEDGAYVTEVINASAENLELSRTRYLIPANEFAAVPVLDANQRIRRSMSQMQKVTVAVPGYLHVFVGQAVWISHPDVSLPNLLAEEVLFTLEAKGEQTRLTLTSMLYI